MEMVKRFDLVTFEIDGYCYISKLFRIEGKFGFVDYIIGDDNSGGLSQHKKEQRILLSEVKLLIRRTQDVFKISELQKLLKNAQTH